MDNLWVIAIMWFSGWYYFGKLRDRIEELEKQVLILSMNKEWSNGKSNS